MKNIKNLLLASLAMVSMVSNASLMQPHVAVSEDAPVRVTAGLQGGFLRNAEEKKMGVNNMGLGLGFAHNVGYDFEYGLALAGNWATPEFGRLFTPATEKASGVRLDVELLARFMPQITESIRLGGYVSVGYGSQFGGEALKAYKEFVAFGDLAARVGIIASFAVSDNVTLSLAPTYALTSIRFASDKVVGDAAKEDFKKDVNFSGVELPLSVMFGIGDNVGLSLEANTIFRNVKKFAETWKEEVTVAVSMAI